MKRVNKEELKAKIKKNKKKIIIISCLSAVAAGIAGYSAIRTAMRIQANNRYVQGCIDSAKMLECYNYESIKQDVIEHEYDRIFDLVYNKDRKVDITCRKDGKRIFIVGDNQKMDFIKHCCKDQGIAAQVHLMLTAKPGDVVQTF